MAPVFFISSIGASATQWLSSKLSMHPEIVCFHSAGTFPPNIITADGYMDFLVKAASYAGHQKIFGGCHGFDGQQALRATKKAGGVFATILRDPVKRIHSLFTHHYTTETGYSGTNIYQNIRESGEDFLENRSDPENFRSNPVLKLFFTDVFQVIGYDLFSINCTTEPLFKMEQFISDPEYFSTVVKQLTDGKAVVTEDYLERVYQSRLEDKRKYRHARKDLHPDEIIREWPPSFRLTYELIIQKMGGDEVYEKYQKIGYKLPIP